MAQKDSSNTVSLNIPKFWKKGNFNYSILLVALLVVASFLIGVLFTKVTYLEKNGGGSADATAQAPTGDTAPAQPQAPTGPVDVAPGHLPALGEEDAKVSIVEFSDFQCPFCVTLFKDTLPQIKKDYVDSGKAKFSYRHYPLDFHANAQKAAEASECANEQDKFWEMHDVLFEKQTSWQDQAAADAAKTFNSYATDLGLNGGQFSDCLESSKYAKAVKDDAADGTKIGVSGTPATYINGLLVSGAQPYAEFKKIIDAELAK